MVRAGSAGSQDSWILLLALSLTLCGAWAGHFPALSFHFLLSRMVGVTDLPRAIVLTWLEGDCSELSSGQSHGGASLPCGLISLTQDVKWHEQHMGFLCDLPTLNNEPS